MAPPGVARRRRSPRGEPGSIGCRGLTGGGATAEPNVTRPGKRPGSIIPATEEVMSEQEDLKRPVEGGDGIWVIRGGGDSRGWNGIRYKTGFSAKNVGARKLSMNVATIPPGGVA